MPACLAGPSRVSLTFAGAIVPAVPAPEAGPVVAAGGPGPPGAPGRVADVACCVVVCVVGCPAGSATTAASAVVAVNEKRSVIPGSSETLAPVADGRAPEVTPGMLFGRPNLPSSLPTLLSETMVGGPLVTTRGWPFTTIESTVTVNGPPEFVDV